MRLESTFPADGKRFFPLTTLPLSFCLVSHPLLLPSSHPGDPRGDEPLPLQTSSCPSSCDSLFAWAFGGFVGSGFDFQQQRCEMPGGATDAACPPLAVGGKPAGLVAVGERGPPAGAPRGFSGSKPGRYVALAGQKYRSAAAYADVRSAPSRMPATFPLRSSPILYHNGV